MEIKQIKKELCIIMNKVWDNSGIREKNGEPCDCICDKKSHDEEYIRIDDDVIEFIKEAVDEKINNINLNNEGGSDVK